MILSIEAHIWLLALRTHGLIVHASNEKLQMIYWSLVKVAIALGVVAVLVRARLFIQGSNGFTKLLELAFAVSSALLGVCTTMIDGISTYWFLQYTRQVLNSFQMQVHNDRNEIVSKMGIYICSLSFLSTILYGASRAV
jgi:ABC-type sulfate transport system permease subunit